MFHFFPRYIKDASDTPFGAELRRLGVPHRFHGEVLSHRYKSLLELVFVVHGKLLWFTLRNAWRSLVTGRPLPTVVVVNSDIETLVFGGVRWLLRRRVLIVFETFIFVPKRGWVGRLHQRYIAGVLRIADVAICHARLEVVNCQQRFPNAKARFVFVPYGTALVHRQELMDRYGAAAESGDTVLSAGKSGRDYATLARGAQGLPCHVQIICDFEAPVAALQPGERLQVLRNCHGHDYLNLLAQAKIVVVPLAVDDISAGQMVLLQAFALRKPVIITRTQTTEDYAEDGVDVLMVPMGDADAMHAALQRLLTDKALRQRLGEQGERRFVEVNSTEAYVRNFVAMIREHMG